MFGRESKEIKFATALPARRKEKKKRKLTTIFDVVAIDEVLNSLFY